MSNLGEDAEAFFRSGDEGTYDGGPASVVPFALSDEPTEEPTLVVTAEQLERRRRLKRLVTTIVGALGAGVLLIFAWVLGASVRTPEDQSATARLPESERETNLAAARAANIGVESLPSAPAPAPTEAATDDRTATAPATPQRAALTAQKLLPHPAPSSAGRPGARVRAPSNRNVALGHAFVSSATPTVHSPPTATFPD